MKIIYKNTNLTEAKMSIILIDWSVRHSFHILDYLNQQSIPRDKYEIIWIEYYTRIPEKLMEKLNISLKKGLPVLDQWLVMENPEDFCHHKHRMFNLGIVASRGEIIVIPDSDAIVKNSFVESIIKTFNENDNIALHIDEIRNQEKKFYPFNYPSIDEVLSEGKIYRWDGKAPVSELPDPVHLLNYGACLSARKDDLIKIGGADEHISYLGHICGVYDMTFRLKNIGKEEVWHTEEFLYHTWHPGQGGSKIDYRGPNDGLDMSTTTLTSIFTGRVLPLIENPAVRLLRTGTENDIDYLLSKFQPVEEWRVTNIKKHPSFHSFLKQHPDSYFNILPTYYKMFLITFFIVLLKFIPNKIKNSIRKTRKQILTEDNISKRDVNFTLSLLKKIHNIPKWFCYLLYFTYAYNKNILENSIALFYNNPTENEFIISGNKDIKKIIKYISKKFKVTVREIGEYPDFSRKLLIAIIPELEIGDFDIYTVNWKKYERKVRDEITKLSSLNIKKEDIYIL